MNIRRDTREKVGFWTFAAYKEINTNVLKVDCGDYILEDYPLGITIDRKKTLAELAGNLKEKRFQKELALMNDYEEAYILCEFPFSCFSMYPTGSGIPKEKWPYLKKGGMAILQDVNRISKKYNVDFLYTNDKFEAEKLAVELFNNFIAKKENNEY